MSNGSLEPPRQPLSYESLSVAAVARLIGVAPSTLRTWARRYGLEPSGHRSGLHRRYSETDLARLRYMRSLTQSGMSSRDAAERAMAATNEELAESLAGPGDLPELGGSALCAQMPVEHRRPGRPERLVAGEVPPAVQTLLGTLGNGDAQGSAALLRLALRDLGAARTWDERVLPARGALWRLTPSTRARVEAMLNGVVVTAVGDVRLRRPARNTAPVHVAHLPGHADPAATTLLMAALCERSIGARELSLGGEAQSALRVLGSGLRGVLAVYVPDDPVAAQLGGRLRQPPGGSAVEQVQWGKGWINWPGQAGTMSAVVRVVEGSACPSGS